MEPIIKELTNEMVESYGFTSTGFNWTNPLYPFTIVRDLKGGGYKPVFKDPPIGFENVYLKLNAELVQLMMHFTKDLVTDAMKDKDLKDPEVQAKMPETIATILMQSFQKDKNIAFNLQIGQMGEIAVQPGNEYTFTLLSGVQCHFQASFINEDDGLPTIEDIYINPNCMSYPYLKRILNTGAINGLSIQTTETDWEPFFGLGLGLPSQN